MNKEKYKQAIKDFRLMDDTFMSAAFDGNIEGTQLVLNIILNRSDLVVTEVVAQREYKNLIDRSIRLDIYAKDSSGKEYDIEVQRAKDGSECRRARYHSSMMDTKMLKKNIKHILKVGGNMSIHNLMRIGKNLRKTKALSLRRWIKSMLILGYSRFLRIWWR